MDSQQLHACTSSDNLINISNGHRRLHYNASIKMSGTTTNYISTYLPINELMKKLLIIELIDDGLSCISKIHGMNSPTSTLQIFLFIYKSLGIDDYINIIVKL